ncbi:MAG: flagellar basal-body rod protein FlgG [Maricaulis sp.]|jgi:flagellar basal-body rod protein FlgG|uniref:flagellar basal-body rod protein FlgG n=1 Tax=Maricaulis sp. TaxID=1486257 RepID=UPI001B1D7101|nr:flagellar basal-body rod protein FlgG [Maricaulis sp.]MEC9249023.1 flagellar basal-body rod protein FlgG [Pseudomonadota bacterium]MBO6730734.1 flagellar basal-body rod protein FlgG [Maricaulis sp.]MBO6847115.1 flagellar basal-body rod protein FlgG [Maricaulis sp.]MBO6876773.1 flagellar basal-body rod protein FlgG [Maricaulis sp.]MDM7983952.1 flagellar basal-body rod protein FlgG [Maricaulis sp.]
MRALSTAATGMEAQQLNVEVISNNLANMNTTGFKRQRAEFQDLLYQNVQSMGVDSSDAGTIVPTGVQVGLGVETASIYRITEQGSLNNTGNDFDLAISGRGYFRIQMPDGTDAYTRAGNFAVSPDGQIVTSEGYTVSPGIAIPQGTRDISINEQGQVQVLIDGQTAPQTVGQLELSTFFNEAGLEAMGNNLFLESAASGTATAGTPGSPGFGSVRQGFVEGSNVNSVSEITALISAQRAYEMNARVITAADEMLATSSNLR